MESFARCCSELQLRFPSNGMLTFIHCATLIYDNASYSYCTIIRRRRHTTVPTRPNTLRISRVTRLSSSWTTCLRSVKPAGVYNATNPPSPLGSSPMLSSRPYSTTTTSRYIRSSSHHVRKLTTSKHRVFPTMGMHRRHKCFRFLSAIRYSCAHYVGPRHYLHFPSKTHL